MMMYDDVMMCGVMMYDALMHDVMRCMHVQYV